MNPSSVRQPAADSPGSQEPGLRRFWDQGHCAHRTPRAFVARLLNPEELERVCLLLSCPQRFARADRRLMDLGLAVIVQGKVVPTQTARASLWRERFELRRGSDVRRLAVVGRFEADSAPEALAKAFALAGVTSAASGESGSPGWTARTAGRSSCHRRGHGWARRSGPTCWSFAKSGHERGGDTHRTS